MSATTAYTESVIESHRLASEIQSLLGDLPAPTDEPNAINWAHVGDANEINARLRSALDFLRCSVAASH